ncbi:MAG: hypothetical protein JXM70_10890 [Pirellulales bacterium]|nr:hypothetical protein [Pirellulales bacterium]
MKNDEEPKIINSMSKIILKPLIGITMILLAHSLFPGQSAFAADGKRVVIPFDFVSKFDKGRYGQKMGDMIWKKLSREGGVIIPETMLDVRDTVTSNNIKLTPDTPLDKAKAIVAGDFGADIGIWGSVERVPGHDWDVYDLKIRCVDFSTAAEPKVIYQCNARTKTVSEIPHVYVKAMLDKLYGRKPGGPAAADPLAEKNWETAQNLVTGGDFQSGVGGVPKGWASRGGQQREPLGGLVSWQRDTTDPKNRVIRFSFDKGVGDGFGVMYYSDPFPIAEGAKYRFACRYRSNGPKMIVFIKCYDEVDTTYKPSQQSPGEIPKGRDASAPGTVQRRECYRSQNNLKGPKNVWNTYTNDFTPKHTKYTPTTGRVMLYAYLGAGVVEFDDIVIKQIIPASPGANHKERRHSMETGVTIKEMEENERKSRELKQKRREER